MKQMRQAWRLTREDDLMQTTIDLAKLFGWKAYHTYDSRKSEPGFPDLVLAKAPNLIFAEMKREGKNPTDSQQAWLDELAACTSSRVEVWRPSDLSRIEGVLRGLTGRPK